MSWVPLPWWTSQSRIATRAAPAARARRRRRARRGWPPPAPVARDAPRARGGARRSRRARSRASATWLIARLIAFRSQRSRHQLAHRLLGRRAAVDDLVHHVG